MRPPRRLWAIAILCALTFSGGCRAIDSHDELRSLAGDAPAESTAEPAAAGPAPVAAAGEGGLDGFPLGGSVFPGLGGRLHSSLCDPASDPYSTCL